MRGVLVLIGLGLAVACGDPPAAPYRFKDVGPTKMVFQPQCKPAGIEVHCTVEAWVKGQGSFIATDLVEWSASTDPIWTTATDIAEVVRPGVIRPRKPGEISIHASYLGTHNSSPRSYAVNPAANAVSLAPHLMGDVGGFIQEALIEILDGPDAGKRALTRNGAFYISHMHFGVPFTIRASKAGYVTQTKTHTGIVDDGTSYLSTARISFELKPGGN